MKQEIRDIFYTFPKSKTRVCDKCANERGVVKKDCSRHKCGWPPDMIWDSQVPVPYLITLGIFMIIFGTMAGSFIPEELLSINIDKSAISTTTFGEFEMINFDTTEGHLIASITTNKTGAYPNMCQESGGACFIVPTNSKINGFTLGDKRMADICGICMTLLSIDGESFSMYKWFSDGMIQYGIYVLSGALIYLLLTEIIAWRAGYTLFFAAMIKNVMKKLK